MGTAETAWGRPELPPNVNYREHRDRLRSLGTDEVFGYIYRHNLWASAESVSGQGSEEAATRLLRTAIPALLREKGISSIADVPCGDFGWLGDTGLGVERYFGADIVPGLIERNRRRFARPGYRFEVLDLTVGPLPTVDLVLCRDCLVHLTFAQAMAALRTIARSGARYLLTTTFPGLEVNVDAETGDWRPLNLRLPPFGFGEPEALIVEGCREGGGSYADKALALWPVRALIPALDRAAPRY
ncbi:class I SAM-dependent methyltransferase [Saccharomonospora sp. NPDC006951]